MARSLGRPGRGPTHHERRETRVHAERRTVGRQFELERQHGRVELLPVDVDAAQFEVEGLRQREAELRRSAAHVLEVDLDAVLFDGDAHVEPSGADAQSVGAHLAPLEAAQAQEALAHAAVERRQARRERHALGQVQFAVAPARAQLRARHAGQESGQQRQALAARRFAARRERKVLPGVFVATVRQRCGREFEVSSRVAAGAHHDAGPLGPSALVVPRGGRQALTPGRRRRALDLARPRSVPRGAGRAGRQLETRSARGAARCVARLDLRSERDEEKSAGRHRRLS